MNKADAKKIAADVTRKQLAEMMRRAKMRITDWKEASQVNPLFTKGKSWNIFYPVFMSGRPMSMPAIVNMVWEFGDHLPEELKPKKPAAKKTAPAPYHEEPNFGES